MEIEVDDHLTVTLMGLVTMQMILILTVVSCYELAAMQVKAPMTGQRLEVVYRFETFSTKLVHREPLLLVLAMIRTPYLSTPTGILGACCPLLFLLVLLEVCQD